MPSLLLGALLPWLLSSLAGRDVVAWLAVHPSKVHVIAPEYLLGYRGQARRLFVTVLTQISIGAVPVQALLLVPNRINGRCPDV